MAPDSTGNAVARGKARVQGRTGTRRGGPVEARGGLRGPARAGAVVLALGLGAAGPAGCADDGRALRDPSADQTTTTAGATTSATAAIGTVPATATVRISSDAFAEGGPIPDTHTCRGEGLSPPLLWSGVPLGAAELALVVRDLDAGAAIHWVLAGIPASTGGLAQGTPPEGAVEAANDFGSTGYAPPCPDAGVHHYEFRLYALTQQLDVQAGASGALTADAIESSPQLASAALSGTVTAPA